jgi:hypothetical protein
MNEPTEIKKKSPALALILGFLPTPMALLLLPNLMGHPAPHYLRGISIALCLFSAFCCFASSFMLFARRTGLAIMAGILFLIVNGLIAFFSGCSALVI